ncbi:MAG: hypothetical protein HYR66_02080 [Sphingobacteriales bacterium]|nr:hypothetical protein [Sphingobacteriales bacterium]MBI3718005.1 hypothetical protein [Sphingobacteriales bacterium]
MKKSFLLFFISAIIFACNNESARDNSSDSSSAKDAVPVNDSVAINPSDSIKTGIKSAPDSMNPVKVEFGSRKKADSISR